MTKMDQFSTALDPSYARKRRRRRNLDHRPRTTCNRWSLLHPLILLFLVITPIAAAPSNCLRFADYDYINQLFIDGGPGYKVFLCPSKTYRLSGTIVFTAADQELATYGYPTGSERAILLVAGDMATAIQGDCRRCARVGIASLVIDGNRSKLGRMKDVDSSTGLIVLGNNDGQAVRNTWIKDPRGFTGIHIREGDKLSCTGAIIEKNEIGPVGEEYRPEVDGPDPEMSPLGRPLADGISIACRDSFVRDNTFYDNTDAAIVIYCSPGTLIHANRITARKSSAMAGILAVDSTPFDGDYKGMIIKGNTIDAATRAIRVGIGIGAPVWSDDIDTILKGGSVLANGIKGRYMGFGIAAAGLDGWTFKDNWDEARHQGIKSDRCFDEPVNPDPMAFLYYSEGIKNSVFQPGFVDKEFQYGTLLMRNALIPIVVCIDGLESTAPPKPKDNPPQEVATTAEVAVPTSSPVSKITTGNEVMDDILEHSQQRMMEAIEHLAKRVDILANSAVPAPLAPAAGKGAQLSADVA